MNAPPRWSSIGSHERRRARSPRRRPAHPPASDALDGPRARRVLEHAAQVHGRVADQVHGAGGRARPRPRPRPRRRGAAAPSAPRQHARRSPHDIAVAMSWAGCSKASAVGSTTTRSAPRRRAAAGRDRRWPRTGRHLAAAIVPVRGHCIARQRSRHGRAGTGYPRVTKCADGRDPAQSASSARGSWAPGWPRSRPRAGFDVVVRSRTRAGAEASSPASPPTSNGRSPRDGWRRTSATPSSAGITATDHLGRLADCDLVIESVVEDLPTKRALFAELEQIVKPEGILATNTSTLPVVEMAMATRRAPTGCAASTSSTRRR